MRALVALSIALSLSVDAAWAQEKRVSAQESRLLLLAPYLEDLKPNYQHFGWNAQASSETSYAGVARNNDTPSRAQVYLYQTAPRYYWKNGTTLDEAWIRSAFPFFNSRPVKITQPAPSPGRYARTAMFEVEGARCVAFELRYVSNDVGSPTFEERQSATGIYCPPGGTVLDDALIQRVFEGIFLRRDGRIERLLQGVNKPIPPELLRGEQRQG